MCLFCLLFFSSFVITSCSFPTGEEVIADKDAVTLFFIRSKGNTFFYVPVKRKLSEDAQKEESAKVKYLISELLKGPTDKEHKKGFNTEIPEGTVLLSFEEDETNMIVNLSKQFMSGGGSLSMKARLEQLIKTLEIANPRKPVLLLIEGNKAASMGGEGLMLNNPIVIKEGNKPKDQQNSDENDPNLSS